MTVELGRYGFWRRQAGFTPELAREVEALGFGAHLDRRLAARGPHRGGGAAGGDRPHRHRDRHRQHVGEPGGRGRGVLPPDRGALPRPVPPRRRDRPPGGDARVREPVPDDRRLPGRVGRARGAGGRPRAGRAAAEGARGGGGAHRGHPPVPHDARAHPHRPRAARARRADRAGADRRCRRPRPGRRADVRAALPGPAQLRRQPAHAGLHRGRRGRRRQRPARRRARHARGRRRGRGPAGRAPRGGCRPRVRAAARGRRRDARPARAWRRRSACVDLDTGPPPALG